MKLSSYHNNSAVRMQAVTSATNDDPMAGEAKTRDSGGIFKCSYCPLEERYEYKGPRPPFAPQIKFNEECYVMRDPMSLPNRGEVLALGADCNSCKTSVCLGCSIFYNKRFCCRCAKDFIGDLPKELHAKIKSLAKSESG